MRLDRINSDLAERCARDTTRDHSADRLLPETLLGEGGWFQRLLLCSENTPAGNCPMLARLPIMSRHRASGQRPDPLLASE